MPWSKTDSPYDSLLGVSLTIDTPNVNPVVMLETYDKGPGYLRCSLSCDGKPLATVSHTFTSGIEVIQLPSSHMLLSGTLIVSDTVGYEQPSELPVQLSPLYINTLNYTKNYPEFTINGNKVSLQEAKLTVSGVFYESLANSTLTLISDSNSAEVAVSSDDTSYVTHVNGAPISYYKNEEGRYVGYTLIKLPEYFSISVSADNGTLYLTGNTENTCPLYNIVNPEIPMIYYKNAQYDTPFDICGSGNSFNPMVIDSLQFTSEKLRWDEISSRHDGGIDV